MGLMHRLEKRWGVGPWRVVLILLAFACTGTTVLLLKRPIVDYFTDDGDGSLFFSVIYYVLILPIYNVMLLLYGALFGQFKFFWAFEKRFLARIFCKAKP